MEKRSRRRIRDLVALAAFQGLSQNEIGCARISMMARSTNAPFKGRIQKRKTNHLQIITFGLQRTAGHATPDQEGCRSAVALAVKIARRQSVEPGLPADHAVVTSLPDCSELSLPFERWQSWFTQTAALVCRATPPEAVSIFFQTDIKREGQWVDKSFLVQLGAININETVGERIFFVTGISSASWSIAASAAGLSRTTSRADLSSRNPWNDACRSNLSLVHWAN